MHVQGVIQDYRLGGGGETATHGSKKHGSLWGLGGIPLQNIFFTSSEVII